MFREVGRLAIEGVTNAMVIKAIGIILIVSDKPVAGHSLTLIQHSP
jgi:hypothetical protein